METLTYRFIEPTGDRIARNQRFIIEFPEPVNVEKINKYNAFLVYDDMNIVWCNIACDDEYPNRLYLYPITYLRKNSTITLQLSDIQYGENTLENEYKTFTVGDNYLVYDDELALPYPEVDIPDEPESSPSVPFELVLTRPAYGQPFVQGDAPVIFVFSKPLDPTQDLSRIIRIEKQHVLL